MYFIQFVNKNGKIENAIFDILEEYANFLIDVDSKGLRILEIRKNYGE